MDRIIYSHAVQYYETDKMGITHHSNYIRWMEEARIHFFKEIGWAVEKIEQEGFSFPVVKVECRYRRPTTFPDLVEIEVWIEEVMDFRLKLGYCMTNAEGKTVCEARSEHCFLNQEKKLVNILQDFPEFVKSLEAVKCRRC